MNWQLSQMENTSQKKIKEGLLGQLLSSWTLYYYYFCMGFRKGKKLWFEILKYIRRGCVTLWFPLFFQVFLDKAAKRAVLGLVVKCDNNKRKCDWTGELSSIEVSDSSKIYDLHWSSISNVRIALKFGLTMF